MNRNFEHNLSYLVDQGYVAAQSFFTNGVEFILFREEGFRAAMFGLALNKNQKIEDMPILAKKLSQMDGGHNKFLESMYVWFCVRLPRYIWQEFDTYRVGMTKQSESTVHTIMKTSVVKEDFYQQDITEGYLQILNNCIHKKNYLKLKNKLPESFFQRRQLCTNYKTLRNIYKQRKTHKHEAWRDLCSFLINNLSHKEYIDGNA